MLGFPKVFHCFFFEILVFLRVSNDLQSKHWCSYDFAMVFNRMVRSRRFFIDLQSKYWFASGFLTAFPSNDWFPDGFSLVFNWNIGIPNVFQWFWIDILIFLRLSSTQHRERESERDHPRQKETERKRERRERDGTPMELTKRNSYVLVGFWVPTGWLSLSLSLLWAPTLQGACLGGSLPTRNK